METGKTPSAEAIVGIVPRAIALREMVGLSGSLGLDRVAKRVQELVTADLAEAMVFASPVAMKATSVIPSHLLTRTTAIGARMLRLIGSGRGLGSLLEGLGWCGCRMPEHLAAPFVAEGRLASLVIDDDPARASGPTTIYVEPMRGRTLGRAER